ncbi:MAG: hypothetical protein CM1200mP22_10890 [Dehalococcoidia bacterium]|nr:MAG: hypothetical protein CM1200mP22_10890 [Dehalococcoidia bacterium]
MSADTSAGTMLHWKTDSGRAPKIMTQAPDFLDVLNRRLIDNLSSHVMDMSSESYSGMARFYRVDLADATKGEI